MKIISEPKDESISAYDMEDGQVAVIVKWNSIDNFAVGCIVKRYGKSMVDLKGGFDDSWPEFFTNKDPRYRDNFKVRLLKPGTVVEL